MDQLLALTSRAEHSHFWFRGFRRFVAPLLRRAAGGRTSLDILDCGCGTGYNLGMLGAYGHVYGMDLTAAGLALAARAGRPLVRADATRLPYRDRAFDLVTTFDMLQCVPDDRAAIAEMYRVLRPGGYLVATMAALDALHGDHSVLSEEVRRYSKAGVQTLLRGGGFEPVQVAYAFATTVPLVFAVRTVQRLVRGHAAASGREITVPPAPINLALTMLVTAEAALAPVVSAPIGSSIMALARKAEVS